MSCPRCGGPLEEDPDGAWCPDCKEYWPPDLIEEFLEANE